MTDVATELPETGRARSDGAVRARRLVKSLSPKDALTLRRLAQQKVPEPGRVMIAAKKARLPVSLAAALVLEQRDLLKGAQLADTFGALAVLVGKYGHRDGIKKFRGETEDAEEFAQRLESRERAMAEALREKGPKPAKVVLIPRNWWKRYVFGDTDCERELLTALANVAKDIGTTIYVRNGRRTLAEQQYLYNLYKAGKGNLAAFPNARAPHIRGVAADCAVGKDRTGPNIGDFRGARDAMKKRGLCLCVSGETWHVQRGNNWAA